jgi:DNA gyrase subunit A
MVRMAQDFTLRCPLVDGTGNFGSLDGDAPAAYALHRVPPGAAGDGAAARARSEGPSRSGPTTTAPRRAVVLPARFPNLLVNGSTGIAVGMATNIPPHNLARWSRRWSR